ncbi:uncharacterized protein LOC113320848 [Papaver somniferum]|uniref:uncharacterized protein LOC113320848 n=1 Tax=Papaver somniferum TaxID=3469 RepID=UPI000E700F1F|nr:uncharacterized protein LOC113320848 [Papaver somniferum]
MGNCSLKGIAGNISDPVRIMTDSGGTVEFRGPTLACDVVSEYPGYNVFREGYLSSPLFNDEQLFSSHLYYLLPVIEEEAKKDDSVIDKDEEKQKEVVVVDKRRKSDAELSGNQVRPSFSRVSSATVTDLGGKNLTMKPALEVLPSLGNGVWRVKMVIDTKQLEEILSEQVNIGELIEKTREVAAVSRNSNGSDSSHSNASTQRKSWRPSFSSVFKSSSTTAPPPPPVAVAK